MMSTNYLTVPPTLYQPNSIACLDPTEGKNLRVDNDDESDEFDDWMLLKTTKEYLSY